MTSSEASRAPGERPRTPWERFKLVVRVIEIRLRFIAVLVATGLAIGYWDTLANYWDRWTRPAAGVAVQAEPDTEYYCPMHPSVVRPGLEPNGEVPRCPICGMPLSQRKKGAAAPLPDGVTARVQLSPERIALAGVRTETVGWRRLEKEVVTSGSVRYDESKLSRIVARVSGYIEKLYFDRTYVPVKEGEPLAEIYSPELYTAVRELRVSASAGGSRELVQASRERLKLLGVAEPEIEKIMSSETSSFGLVIRSPQSGHIIQRSVVRGAYVGMGTTLFDVADLSTVWIEADVYEKDISFVREGQDIEATVDAFPERVFKGKVALVHPHVETATRTNPVRFTVQNEGHELRPGMFATVRLRTPLVDLEPWKTLAADAAHVGTGSATARVFACPDHGEVVRDASGACPRCGAALAPRPLAEGERVVWWCPMHPAVTSGGPGARCDLCQGMQLVPRIVTVPRPGEVLAVPERSVIDTGEKRIVYVEREPGVFEGVLVLLGPRTQDQYPVISGLAPGDRVVAAGAFLVDAETRLNPAAAATYVGASGGPRPAGSAAPEAPSQRPPASAPSEQGPPVADAWKELSPEDRKAALAQKVCPVSGDRLGSMGTPFKVVVKGRVIFLCCEGCKEKAAAAVGGGK